MTSVKVMGLNDDQKMLVSQLINRYGTGEHPVCIPSTVDLFSKDYLNEILVNNLDDIRKGLTPEGSDLLDTILNEF